MPDYKTGNEIFSIYLGSNESSFRTRDSNGVTHDYRSRERREWKYSITYLICNKEVIEPAFSIYDVIKERNYIDNTGDGNINEVVDNPREGFYERAPICKK